jgi:uncharacterized membrane protein YccC
MKQIVLLMVALSLGFFITWVDTRPNWDDTGVTALAIFLCCCLLGAIESRRPWLLALAVGLWIPLFGIALQRNFSSLLALVIAFAGAYAGMGIRWIPGQLTEPT